MKLTNKQIVFIEEYLKCWNATEAARRAGYSSKTARSIGSENLTKPDILSAIQIALNTRCMSSAEVLARISNHARANLVPFVNITTEGFLQFDFSNPEAKDNLHLIKSIKSKRTRRIVGLGDGAEKWEDEWLQVELVDSQQALIVLGKHHRLFSEKFEVKGQLQIEGLKEALDKVYGSRSP